MRNIKHLIISFALFLIVVSFVGCFFTNYSSAQELDNIKSSFSNLKGKFIWRADLGQYYYSDKLKLEDILSKHKSEKMVVYLVELLDDKSKTQSTIDNEFVPLGIICYEALTQLVYYEPLTSNGDISQSWPGYISPKSTSKEIKAAKQAWEKVIETKSYIFQ